MRRLVSIASILLLLIVAEAYAQTGVKQEASPKQPANAGFYPLDKVKAGMRATGYTVFEGSEPQPFEVEILGVLAGFPNPQQSAVLAKLVGQRVEHTGVFQGMSGSPVFLEGKLLGAVAFGYAFAKDPIAGITPINQMIEMFETGPGTPTEKGPGMDKPRPISFSEIAFNETSKEFVEFLEGRVSTGVPRFTSASSSSVLMPIATPLAITGVAPEVVAKFARQFESLGLYPVAGVAGAAPVSPLKAANDKTLAPGATIVVPLVRGDFSIAATGTVTHRDGNRIYAFGHPLLSLGISDLPMNEGEVVTVMSSSAISFKLAIPGAMVGAIRGDRSTGIYGELGAIPRMIPVEIELLSSRGSKQTYKFDMVSDRFLTPILLQMTSLATISSTERLIGDSTLQVRGNIKLKGQPEVTFENRLTSSMNAPLAAAFAVTQPINALLNSGFSDLAIERIALKVTSVDARSKGQLDRLWINRSEVKRGEQLEIQAFARTESGGEYIERINLAIPADTPLGELKVVVSDGGLLQASEPRTAITPKSLNHLVRELNRIRKSDRLYVRLERAEGGVVINNEELPNLPPSMLATLSSERTSGGYTLTRSSAVYEKELAPAEFVISGQRTLTVKVVN
jgi:SpoIVB peptidase S55